MSWVNMKKRCNDLTHPNYGGRGIVYDPSWETFAGFFADMGECPVGHTIERSDNALGYNKGNCVWLPRKLQNRNRRNTLTPRQVQLLKAMWYATKEGTGYRTFAALVAPLFHRSPSGIRKIIKGERHGE